MRVKGGGDYYLISRTLGLEFGGSIGIVLFLAQSVSIGFYLIGFGEALSGLLPSSLWGSPQFLALAAGGPLFLLSWLGADWATKFQYVVMGILTAALVSFFVGGILEWKMSFVVSNWSAPRSGQGFWVIFAVFFPAVTGFTQGVSMSGDLKDPGKSLPLGTFMAVGISLLIYLCSALVLAGTLPASTLMTNYDAMQQVAFVDWLVLAGVIAATLSSAMASFLGGPRILQSISADRIFPVLSPFAKGVGPMNNPRRGVLLSAGIALMTIGMGRLNLIAPLVSMFFLISYGLLNYATFFESRAQSPSFRPRFRSFDYRMSLVGALGCLGVMLAINPGAGIVALAILFAIYQYLKQTSGPASWADSQRSYHLQQIRGHLLGAAMETEHPRHWRPQILAFSDDPEQRRQLLETAEWLEGGSGTTSIVHLIEGQGLKVLKQRDEERDALKKDVLSFGSSAFPLCVAAPDVRIGIHILLQSYGVGPLQANTILLNWFHGQTQAGYVSSHPAKNLRSAFHLGYNILMLNAGESKWRGLKEYESKELRIDIWWWGDATSRLMLMLGYLMTRSPFWQGAELRVLAVPCEKESDNDSNTLEEALESYRIEATSMWIQATEASAFVNHSADASLVLLPFHLKQSAIVDPFGGDLNWLLPRLPVTLLCLAAEDLDLSAEPDQGDAALVAEALYSFEEANARYKNTEKETVQVLEKSCVLEKEFRAAKCSGACEEELANRQDMVRALREEADKARKKLAKEKTKAEQARQRAEEMGAILPEKEGDPSE
jgi:amino acid transporter